MGNGQVFESRAREWAEWLLSKDNRYGCTADEELGALYVLGLLGDTAAAETALSKGAT